MPLVRVPTSSRSTSRSPLPPSPRPPNFLPPSHYAEAGGITPRPPARNDSLTSSSDPQYQTQLESRRNSAFMPISSNSDSSFEFGAAASKPVENKRFSIHGGPKGGKSGSSAYQSTPSPRSKRESHMTNLPLVEAQLLPSLRDTIDRMTKAPSRTTASPSSNDSEPSVGSPQYTQSPRTYQPQPSPLPDESAHCLSPPPKPLKSALRAPTPKLQLKSPRPPTPTAVAATTLARGSGPSASKSNNAGAPIPPTPLRSRPRSRTDPGAPPHAQTTSKPPTTPIPTSDPRSDPKGPSSIPRPRALPGLRSASSTPRPRQNETAGDDSASDLELRYELAARDRRSLRVVNGAMSSESDSEGEARAGVGLGLGLAAPYTSRSFASKLRARFTGGNTGAADEAERRRKELLGLVKGLDRLGSQLQGEAEHGHDSEHEYGVVVSGSGRVDFGAAGSQDPPRVMVSSSSGSDGGLDRDLAYPRRDRNDRPTSLWKRSRSLSPAPPPPPPKEGQFQERGTKSPSRSPVIRQPPRPASQAADRADLMPDALRRHSVYHQPVPSRPLSPAYSPPALETQIDDEEHTILTRSPESVYDEPEDDEPRMPDPPAAHEHLRAHDPWQARQRHSEDLANSDTVVLALHSRMAAARDRAALGIPPSASDVGDGGRERMSYMDSGSSLARVGMAWETGGGGGGRGAGDLSFGAERLFRTLSGRAGEGAGERERERDTWGGDREYAFGQGDILKGRAMDPERPVSLVFSQSSSASSVYDEEYEDVPGPEDTEEPWPSGEVFRGEEDIGEEEEESPLDQPAEDAWRRTLSPATCTAVVDRYGPLEIHRQEAIHALCVTEESFIARLTNTRNLFILPLRLQDSKQYISGVPAEIARLFDWFEDILNLHMQLLSALRCVQDAQHPVIERVAEAIRGSFVKRLEVYQPYLARLVNVAAAIARHTDDRTSDFGEFVRIQEGARECGGWSLESLLVDPVSRLGRYPAIFRKLHEYTPKAHADYVPTFALLHSTEMVIKVMTEVKIREDEYDLMKSMAQRIKGLPPSVPLARRGRRLLFQGQLLRVQTDHQHHEESAVVDDRRKSRVDPPKRSSHLVHAIHEWDQRRERSGSIKSNGSASTAASFNSYATGSSAASSEPPLTPSSPRFSSRPSTKAAWPSTPQESPSPHRSGSADAQPGDMQLVQVFVFTDFVIVASVCKSRYDGSEEWALLDHIGIAKVLGVSELSGENSNMPPLLELDVLPVDIKTLVVSDSASLEILHLRVPPSSSQEIFTRLGLLLSDNLQS
ncbi:hypothetical protein B0H17DRAFT_1207673 [Mycena rosella]|uniref:DH domain-containing protein n=1 Tax=Mycena rosella TaxID=1033263 RepID=A0AAD7D6A5_MYCRO|nr:hypothetical protein B0H17DRAFT_1207673 [Mycena rosella]